MVNQVLRTTATMERVHNRAPPFTAVTSELKAVILTVTWQPENRMQVTNHAQNVLHMAPPPFRLAHGLLHTLVFIHQDLCSPMGNSAGVT